MYTQIQIPNVHQRKLALLEHKNARKRTLAHTFERTFEHTCISEHTALSFLSKRSTPVCPSVSYLICPRKHTYACTRNVQTQTHVHIHKRIHTTTYTQTSTHRQAQTAPPRHTTTLTQMHSPLLEQGQQPCLGQRFTACPHFIHARSQASAQPRHQDGLQQACGCSV
jgi:hypothetical protein